MQLFEVLGAFCSEGFVEGVHWEVGGGVRGESIVCNGSY